ncbi:hypothetical protein KR038_003087 [Drosophila bunnanda]|nr:hypothetical protein KR038_003087 [Drosophila bunnanda]
MLFPHCREDARSDFTHYYYISLIAFALAVLLLTVFIFADGLRFMQVLNLIISFLIVELQIIATFILVVLTWWADLLVFFAVAAALIFLFLLLGIILPQRVDLTLDIAVLFIIAFIFLIIAVFALTLLMCLWFPTVYTYFLIELAVTLTILMFVVYHAQTIHGNRFAEMRLNDYFLGSLILFHDFLIIFWLTFYWQIRHRLVTPDSWVATSKSVGETTNNYGKNWQAMSLGTIYTEPGDDFGMPDEDQDEDSSQNRHITRKPDRGSQAYYRKIQRKQNANTTPMDWGVFRGGTKASHVTRGQPAPQIRKPVDGVRRPGVLYKVSPVDGSKFPPPEEKVVEKDIYNFGPPKKKYGPALDYGNAKGKPKVGSGKSSSIGFGEPSLLFPVTDPPSNVDPASLEWEEYKPYPDHLNSGQMHQGNSTAAKEPNLLDDEMQGSKGAERPQPDFEVLSQEQLKNLSDSKMHRVKQNDTANPNAEPLTTSTNAQTRVPDYQKLAMNSTTVAN